MYKEKKEKTLTKGDVIVEDIKIGDIHYEYEFDFGQNLEMKCKVLTLPKKNKRNQWEWQSMNLKTKRITNYLVDPKYSHYSANLYNSQSYQGCTRV